MSKTEWTVFGAIIAAVAIGVAVEPDHEDMAGHDHETMVMEATPTSRTVTLAVSGMT